MFIYWAFFCILAIGALLNSQENVGRTRLMFVLLASLPTALMIGLRWQIGPDWAAYMDIFNYTRFWGLAQCLSHGDPGFFGLLWLLHQVAAPFWVLNLVCGTVFVSGLTAFSRRQPNPWLAFLVAFPYLCIVVAMSGDRQSVAIGLLFFALNAFDRGKLGRFVLLAIMAALFHGSVLLVLPLCLLSYTRSAAQRAALLLIAFGLGIYFFKDVFSIYARRYSSDRIQSSGVAYRLAMNALSAIIFLLLGKRFEFDDHQHKLWRNISLFSLALIGLVLIVPSSTAIDRFLLYVFPLQFVVLSRLPKLAAERNAEGQLTLMVIFYAALVQVTFLMFGAFAKYYIPYRAIFQA